MPRVEVSVTPVPLTLAERKAGCRKRSVLTCNECGHSVEEVICVGNGIGTWWLPIHKTFSSDCHRYATSGSVRDLHRYTKSAESALSAALILDARQRTAIISPLTE